MREGETRWIQIPAEGETEEDLENPAPAVTLTAEEEEHDAAAEEDAAAARGVREDDDDDFASKGLGIAALVLGGLGLGAGGTALMRSRKG